MKIKNNKGMTLIEIVVVLLMSSILMMIVGSIILNSMGFFNKETVQDSTKLAADKIATLVRDELLYASEVVIDTEKPDGRNWNWFSLDENGHLLLNDETLYNDDFYTRNTLEVQAQLYKGNRFDLSIKLVDSEGEQAYKTATTIELVNINEEVNSSNALNSKSGGLGTSVVDITYGGNKIYYIKGTRDISPVTDPAEDITGTVADREVNCMDKEVSESGNNKGQWKNDVTYSKGDFIQYSGQIYMATNNIGANQPPREGMYDWQKISRYYNANSMYFKGDVVLYQIDNLYYQVQGQEFIVAGYNPQTSNVGWSKGFKTIDELHADESFIIDANKCLVSSNKSCTGTISDKLYENKNTDIKQFYVRESGGAWTPDENKTGTIKVGDVVKFNYRYIGNATDSQLLESNWKEAEWSYYVALTNNTQKYIPGKAYVDASNYKIAAWQYVGPVDNKGKPYVATYDNINVYLAQRYYSNSLKDTTSLFAKTGDIIYSAEQNKYFAAGGTNLMFALADENPNTYNQWKTMWREVSQDEVDAVKKACELKLKDSK